MRTSTATKLGRYAKSAMVAYGLSMVATMASAGEPTLKGFSNPVAFAPGQDGAFYVSNWGGGTVERVDPNGSRSAVLNRIASPAGLAIDQAGALYTASYQDDIVVRMGLDGTRQIVARGLSTPTGISFAQNGRLLVANRSSGQIVALDVAAETSTVIARGLALPVGVVEMADRSIVVSQYGGRVTRILTSGKSQELGGDFARPGVGILGLPRRSVLRLRAALPLERSLELKH